MGRGSSFKCLVEGSALERVFAVGFLRLGEDDVGDFELGTFEGNTAFDPKAVEAVGADVARSDLNAEFF